MWVKVEVSKGRFFRFFYSPDNENWVPVKVGDEYTVDGKFLPAWGAGVRSGIFVDGDKGESAEFSDVRFDYYWSSCTSYLETEPYNGGKGSCEKNLSAMEINN